MVFSPVNGSKTDVKNRGRLLPLGERKEPVSVNRTIPVNIDNEDRK